MSNTILVNADAQPTAAASRRALFVDLDGTLIAGDLLRKACFEALRRPTLWPPCFGWLLRGRARFKTGLSTEIEHDPQALTFRPEVLELVRRRKAAGDRIVLATATARRWAIAVAEHLGCFDDVLSTTAQENLKAGRKLAAIESDCRLHAIERFGYVGDSLADVPIWAAAHDVYVVGRRYGVLARVRRLDKPYVHLGSGSATAAAHYHGLGRHG